jgi:nucleotide-binding universal stress UspA family protein
MSHVHKMLVPMDGSPCSIAALSYAITLAEDLDAAIDVLHVNGANRFEVGSTAAATETAQEQSARAMEEAVARAKGQLGERLGRRTEHGEPVRVILELAAAEKFDLIVMGTHGRVGRLYSLTGSVAEAVVRSSPCPVVTIRKAGGEEESFDERIHGRPAIADQARPGR